jgi:hypothetical protein
MLVSAIMPTRARPLLSQTALNCWRSQAWPDKELIILDDADDLSFPAPPNGPGVRYYRALKRTIGAKREWLCAQAQGEVIIHFDSDDWSDPGRIDEQVSLLLTSGRPMTGYHSLLFWDMRNAVGYRWKGPEGFAVGTSMCYTREFWKSHRWPEYSGLPSHPRLEATDVEVARTAQKHGGVATLDGRQMCIARAHSSNTSTARNISRVGWPKVKNEAFPAAFFAALDMEGMEKRAA